MARLWPWPRPAMPSGGNSMHRLLQAGSQEGPWCSLSPEHDRMIAFVMKGFPSHEECAQCMVLAGQPVGRWGAPDGRLWPPVRTQPPRPEPKVRGPQRYAAARPPPPPPSTSTCQRPGRAGRSAGTPSSSACWPSTGRRPARPSAATAHSRSSAPASACQAGDGERPPALGTQQLGSCDDAAIARAGCGRGHLPQTGTSSSAAFRSASTSSFAIRR